MDEEFTELAQRLAAEYPATGADAVGNIELWLSGELPLVPRDPLVDFLRNAPLDLVHESFWRNIPFGTGGVRGTVGFGPNRLNRTVVALTIQAHCNFLNKHVVTDSGSATEQCVVVANDVRRFLDASGVLKFLSDNPLHADRSATGVSSRSLAHLAAEVYAANGFTTYIMSPHDDAALLTTPELSFLIRWLHASGGINMSASHNPPDDNGIKVYDEKGGQYLPPYDERLTEETQKVRTVQRMPYSEAVEKGLVRDVPAEGLAAYMQLYLDRAQRYDLRSARNTRILFTPLCGCGGQTVGRALANLDYAVHTPAGEGPDGTFGSIPLLAPNPEFEQALRNSKAEADAVGARLVLATDPDADRLGAEVFHRDAWRHLTGNQIATILAYYLLLDENGPQLRGGVYQTIVTTLAVREIAEAAGCTPIRDDLLVGFKYIGEAVQETADRLGAGASDTALLTFAAEESHGYLDSPHLRDKDAMAGALYLAKLHETLAEQDLTLVDYYEAVFARIRDIGDRGRSIIVRGSAGVRAINEVMKRLRDEPPTTLGDVAVEEIVDYRDEAQRGPIKSNTDREARNVLVFRFDGGRITLRPSGTEPKLKFYVQTTEAGSAASAQAYADALSDLVYRDLLRVLGYELDVSLAGLPDVVPLDAKLEFQDEVLPEMRRLITEEERPDDFVARWMHEQVSRLIPGDGAWEVGYPALHAAVGSWDADDARRARAVLDVGTG